MGMSFLKNNGAIRATRSGEIPKKTKAEWLADYERMLETGVNLLGQRLSDRDYKHIELQADMWRRELGNTTAPAPADKGS